MSAMNGAVTPIIPNFQAVSRCGFRYPALWLVPGPNGIPITTLAEGQTSMGNLYFDVNTDDPVCCPDLSPRRPIARDDVVVQRDHARHASGAGTQMAIARVRKRECCVHAANSRRPSRMETFRRLAQIREVARHRGQGELFASSDAQGLYRGRASTSAVRGAHLPSSAGLKRFYAVVYPRRPAIEAPATRAAVEYGRDVRAQHFQDHRT